MIRNVWSGIPSEVNGAGGLGVLNPQGLTLELLQYGGGQYLLKLSVTMASFWRCEKPLLTAYWTLIGPPISALVVTPKPLFPWV
jgi:hypothetical protein